MQADPVVIKASELLRIGLMPSAEEIKKGIVSLSDFNLISNFANRLVCIRIYWASMFPLLSQKQNLLEIELY